MKLAADLREFAELLSSRRVDYLIVGGHAVAFHGHPRFTGDIDFLLRPNRDTAARVLDALAAFGFADTGLAVDDLIAPEQVIQLGRPPNRIDLLTSISGVSFDEAWAGRVEGLLGDIRVWFIGRAELVANKRASGRPQDLADLHRLEQIWKRQP